MFSMIMRHRRLLDPWSLRIKQWMCPSYSHYVYGRAYPQLLAPRPHSHLLSAIIESVTTSPSLLIWRRPDPEVAQIRVLTSPSLCNAIYECNGRVWVALSGASSINWKLILLFPCPTGRYDNLIWWHSRILSTITLSLRPLHSCRLWLTVTLIQFSFPLPLWSSCRFVVVFLSELDFQAVRIAPMAILPTLNASLVHLFCFYSGSVIMELLIPSLQINRPCCWFSIPHPYCQSCVF